MRRVACDRPPAVLVVLIAVLLLVPDEGSLFLGPLRLPLSRAILLVMTPIAVTRLMKDLSARKTRFVWSDLLFPVTAVWMILAVYVIEGPERAFVGAGATALDLVGAYFATRALLTEPGQALRLAKWFALLMPISTLLAVPDRFAGYYVWHDVVGHLTGHEIDWLTDVRRGSLRAAGTFEHPILLGTACSFGLLLGTSLLRGARRWFVQIGCAVGLLVAISSAPILASLIGLSCLYYRRLTPGFESRWRWLMLAAGSALGLLFATLPAPFGWLIGHATLDPGTGFYRLLIWQVAGADLMNSPLFGLGLADAWARPSWMPPTVDSVWLRSALSFGIPGSLLLAASLIGACSKRVDTRRARLTPEERTLGMALSLIVFLYIFLGFTVHFWGIDWVLMGVFAGMRAHLGALATRGVRRSRSPASPAPSARQSLAYATFNLEASGQDRRGSSAN